MGCYRPRKRTIQYSAPFKINRRRLWNAGCRAFAGHDDLWLGKRPQEHKLRVIIHSPFPAPRNLPAPRIPPLSLPRPPAALLASASRRRAMRPALSRQAFCVGRIEKHQRERLHRMCRAEIGGIAAVHFVTPPKPRASTLLRSSARASVPLSTNSANLAPREIASRPSAPVPAKQVEHTRVGNRIVIGMNENIEQRLAQAVRSGTDIARGWRRQVAALQSSPTTRIRMRSESVDAVAMTSPHHQCAPSPMGRGLG